MADAESLGELSRRQDRFEHAVGADFAELRATIQAATAQSVPVGTYQAERIADRAEVAAVTKRQDSLEGRITWAWRTALTALAFPIIVAAVTFLMRGGA